MHSGLFSAYRQGENRVTSSMLSVFERLDIGLLRRILGAATSNQDIPLLTFVNQPSASGASSVPDAAITANIGYYFEVKTDVGAVRGDQLRAHLSHLNGTFRDERLFVLTPDRTQPPAVHGLHDERVTWFSFRDLAEAIDDALGDRFVELAELQRYLLRELLALFDRDGLLGSFDTAVVPVNAGSYALYRDHGVYLCQPGRSISEHADYVAFYHEGEIKPYVARIRARRDDVVFDLDFAAQASAKSCLGQTDLIYAKVLELIEARRLTQDTTSQVFVLSGAEDPETIRLPHAIRGDAASPSGRRIAWVRYQRYVYSDDLRTAPQTTSELDRFTALR